MPVDRRVLAAGLQQLTKRYVGALINRITTQTVNDKPMYLMHGPSPTPPKGLPGQITVPGTDGRPVAVPIMWAPLQMRTNSALPEGAGSAIRPKPKVDERDLDDFMWAGGTPIDRRDVATVYMPGPVEKFVTAGKIPETKVEELRVSIDTTGDWGVWTKPFDARGCLCCTTYATPTNIFTYVVPPDYTLFIDAWAFFVASVLPIGWQFNVRFLRDGETLLEYNEVVVDPLNPDPAKRCAFSGSIEQVQNSWLRIDRNQVFSVVITPLGLAPFVNTSADTFCETLCVLLHGHLQALLDNRDGAPRPKDVGRLRDDLWGTGTLDEVTMEDVTQLYSWLNGAVANAEPAPDAGDRTATSDDALPKAEIPDDNYTGSAVSPDPLS